MTTEETLSKIYHNEIDFDAIKFEQPYHVDRLKSLKQMADRHSESSCSTSPLRKIEVYV
jgi:hypothetical protein